jgi:hypothetical protein
MVSGPGYLLPHPTLSPGLFPSHERSHDSSIASASSAAQGNALSAGLQIHKP